MTGFAGWNLLGNCSAIACTQGINILLNMFFGPTINAARGIAVQVQNAVTQFSLNFQTAVNPQIIKSYATKDYEYMHKLIFKSSKFTFFMIAFISLPILLETDTILAIWLKNVPDYTIIFLRLILCITIVDAIANPLLVSAAATGKVKLYQSVIGGILLTILPISYITLKSGGKPESVFIIHLAVCIIAFVARLFILKSMIRLNVKQYFNQVIIKCLIILIISLFISIGIKSIMENSFYSFIIVCLCCALSVSISTYFLGLDKSEKEFIIKRITSIINK